MKNMIKNTLLTLALAVGLTSFSYGAQIVITVPANGITNILTGNGRIQQFVLTSTSSASNILAFVDSPTNQLNYVLGAYSNVTYTVGSITNVYTNYFNVLTTNIYTGQTTVTNSVAAVTNSYNGLLTAYVTALSTLTIGNGITFPNGSTYYYYQGVTVTNTSSGAATITLTYQQ